MAKNDSWYAPLELDDGSTIYGAAALNKRIANSGGQSAVIAEACQYALDMANARTKAKETKSKSNKGQVIPIHRKKTA